MLARSLRVGAVNAAVALRQSRGWFLVTHGPERAMGPALAWGHSEGVDELDILVDPGAGDLARKAKYFVPCPKVWQLTGESSVILPVEAQESDLAVEAEAPAPALAWVEMIEGSGAEAVVEEGSVRAEYLGLEVARVISRDDQWVLDVGVGRYDRELRSLVEGHYDPASALAKALHVVRRWRRMGLPAHPANQLAPERWLRSVIMALPELLGPDAPGILAPLPGTVSRPDLGSRAPAACLGLRGSGPAVAVVCSVGVDPDLVPAAADLAARARSTVGQAVELWIVVPEGDDHPNTRRMAQALCSPAQVRLVPTHWRDLKRS
ncbi:MAG: hypothetical protein ACRD0I_00935 [Acidimicrobiales bacterium]